MPSNADNNNLPIERRCKKIKKSHMSFVSLIAKSWLILVLAVSPLIIGSLIMSFGQEKEIYLTIKEARANLFDVNFNISGILVARNQHQSFRNVKRIEGVLTELDHWSDVPGMKNILLISIWGAL